MPAGNSKFQVDPGNAAYIFIAPSSHKNTVLVADKIN